LSPAPIVVLGQVHGRAHVEVDDAQLVVQVGARGERAARVDAGVERDRVDRAPGGADARGELLHALGGREVGLDGVDGPAVPLELRGGGAQLAVLGAHPRPI